ncbi:MAG: hypothetical protein OEU76_04245, partial [Cyclobacteriaceae bacterium]|nr:hypothetical protein [Cyclobacteriaceae bacterium]
MLASVSMAFGQREVEEGRRQAGSQIIDDTTRQIYGPTTSQFFLRDDIFFNRWISYPIDTVIRNFHQFTPVQQFKNFHQ